MTLRAGRSDVRAGQSECRLRVVIEGGAGPVRGRMTRLAVLRKSGRHVIRILGRLIFLQMAGGARGSEALVHAARMTLRAGCRDVRSGQSECRLRVVIERGARPVCSRVTRLAVLRESGGGVVWIRGRLIFLQMARRTVCGQTLVNAARMTLSAGCRDVRACQSERRLRVVIECGSRPVRGRMTQLAILRERSRDVIRVRRALVLFQMTRGAGGRAQARELPVGVALRTCDCGVSTRQWEFRLVMIELRAQPLCGGVAYLAILREPC